MVGYSLHRPNPTSGEAKHQLVLYEYQLDRKHIHPKNFLKDFKGYLLFANTPNGAETQKGEKRNIPVGGRVT